MGSPSIAVMLRVRSNEPKNGRALEETALREPFSKNMDLMKTKVEIFFLEKVRQMSGKKG